MAAAIAALVLTGCAGGEEEPARWGGPPGPASDGTLAVAGFERHQAEVEEPWERTPLSLAAEFLRVDAREPTAAAVDVELAPEGATTATVTVTFEGLLDDSVRDARYTLQIGRAGGRVWRLRAARYAQRCRPGRGHEGFSPEPCV